MRSEILAIAEQYVEKFYASEQAVFSRLLAGPMNDDDDEEDKSDLIQYVDNIAVVSIRGALTDSSSWINSLFGLIAYDDIRQAIIEGIENQVEGMMFHIGSPGGKVAGMADLGNFIASLPIPTVTFSDAQMASAALFLGIQADKVYADSFADIGSVGVVMNIMDYSEQLKKDGVKPRRYRSGDLKQAGSPFFKPSDKEEKYLMEQVMLYAEKFFNLVSTARGIPRPLLDSLDITSGRTFIGEQALQVGLVDDIVTFDQAVAKTMELAKKNVDKNRPRTVIYA
jgi:protease IV